MKESSPKRNIENLEAREMVRSLDANSGSIGSLIHATNGLKETIVENIHTYTKERLGYVSDDIQKTIEDQFTDRAKDIVYDLEKEQSDMSFLEKLWFRTGRDILSNAREWDIAEQINPLEDSIVQEIERMVDREYYLIQFTKARETYQKGGKEGGLDAVGYAPLEALFKEIDYKNQKYTGEGALLDDVSIQNALDIIGLDQVKNPLLILARGHKNKKTHEDVLKELLQAYACSFAPAESAQNIAQYFQFIHSHAEEGDVFSLAHLYAQNLVGSEKKIQLSPEDLDKTADFLRFIYADPSLSEAFVGLLSKYSQGDMKPLKEIARTYPKNPLNEATKETREALNQ